MVVVVVVYCLTACSLVRRRDSKKRKYGGEAAYFGDVWFLTVGARVRLKGCVRCMRWQSHNNAHQAVAAGTYGCCMWGGFGVAHAAACGVLPVVSPPVLP